MVRRKSNEALVGLCGAGALLLLLVGVVLWAGGIGGASQAENVFGSREVDDPPEAERRRVSKNTPEAFGFGGRAPSRSNSAGAAAAGGAAAAFVVLVVGWAVGVVISLAWVYAAAKVVKFAWTGDWRATKPKPY